MIARTWKQIILVLSFEQVLLLCLDYDNMIKYSYRLNRILLSLGLRKRKDYSCSLDH